MFCDPQLPDYTIRNCGIDFAGVVGLGIINIHENPTDEDLEDPEFWAAKFADPKIKYWGIRNTRGEYSGGEQIEEEDLIGSVVTGANHEAIIDVPGLKENYIFWDEIQKSNWKMCLVTSGGLMYYINKPVSFYPKISNPKSIKSQAFFQVQMKWQDFSNPIILNEPEGIFAGDIPVISDGEGIFDYTFDYTFG